MYENPFKAIYTRPTYNFHTEMDNLVAEEVQRVGIMVDKEEIIKALQYDRDQYEKGLNDGIAKAVEILGDGKMFK